MANLKEIWNKLEHWKKGGILGLITGLIIFIVLHNHYFNTISTFGLGGFLAKLLPLFIVEVFIPVIYGSVIGSIYNKLPKTAFFLVFLITIVALIYVMFTLILSIAKPF